MAHPSSRLSACLCKLVSLTWAGASSVCVRVCFSACVRDTTRPLWRRSSPSSAWSCFREHFFFISAIDILPLWTERVYVSWPWKARVVNKNELNKFLDIIISPHLHFGAKAVLMHAPTLGGRSTISEKVLAQFNWCIRVPILFLFYSKLGGNARNSRAQWSPRFSSVCTCYHVVVFTVGSLRGHAIVLGDREGGCVIETQIVGIGRYLWS